MTKRIAIGVTCSGKFEFGDLYHVAVAILCFPKLPVAFVDNNGNHQNYFEFLLSLDASDLVRVSVADYQEKKRPRDGQCFQSVSETANVFRKYLCKNSLAELVRKCEHAIDDGSSAKPLLTYLISKLGKPRANPKVLVWIRNESFDECRNATEKSVEQLVEDIESLGFETILIGNELGKYTKAKNNLIEFHCDDKIYHSSDPVRTQLRMFRLLRDKYNVIASVGMMSGGMDGPAFFANLPVIFFKYKTKNKSRMEEVSKMFKGAFFMISYELNGQFEEHSQSERTQLKERLTTLNERRKKVDGRN